MICKYMHMHKERVWQFVDAIVSSKLNDSISTHVSTLRTHEHGHELVHTPLNLQTKRESNVHGFKGLCLGVVIPA